MAGLPALCFVFVLCLNRQRLLAVASLTTSNTEVPRIYIPGDVLIGGLAPIHYPPSTSSTSFTAAGSAGRANCGGKFNVRGLQMAEAIVYAVHKINKDSSLLPGIKLGVDVRDTCNSVDFAIREALHFSFVKEAYTRIGEARGCANMTLEKPRLKTVAIVGAAYSGISIAIANLAGLFHVPVLSYASTSRLLSDQSRFQNFLRTVPSDTLQAEALAEVIREYGWNFVAAIASDTEYGRSGIQAFKDAATRLDKTHICVSVDELFTVRTPKEQVTDIVQKVKSFRKVRVIVLFAELNDAEYFIESAQAENLTGYIWLGSDAWSESYQILRKNSRILKDFVGFKPGIQNYKPFKEYFKNITTERKSRNFWLRHHLREVEKEMLNSDLEFTIYSSTAIDAVYAVAHGLRNMYRCTDSKCIVNVSHTNQTKVYEHIRNVSFLSPTQNRVAFNANGSAMNFYNLTITEENKGRLKFVSFGSWHPKNGVKTYEGHAHVKGRLENLSRIASCSKECTPGFRKEPRVRFPECCWDCLRCQGNTVTNQSGATICITCPLGYKANPRKSTCDIIPPTVLKWSSATGIVIVCTCALGVLAVLGTFVVFVIHRDTPVVKASSCEICYLLLLGLACSYVAPILIMVQSDATSCKVGPFISNTGICLVIGSLLTKTNRIARIFSLKFMCTGKAYFLGTGWQIGFVWVCVLAGNMVVAAWVVLEPPQLATVVYKNGQVALECLAKSMTGFAVWITYNVGLVLITTYQAFLIRKVPENYNEAKFIAFTMLTLCLGGGVYIPTCLGTRGMYRAVLSCFILIFCSTAVLACIFGPKLYIIFFRPQKNYVLEPRRETELTKSRLHSSVVLHESSSTKQQS